ncbi:P-type cation exchange, alpha subunit of ATPase [Ramicandelaber brevisporus]|nr:P-type cation exchange, alpha subunit of ATPase [Ramicandelaber brevisporus]
MPAAETDPLRHEAGDAIAVTGAAAAAGDTAGTTTPQQPQAAKGAKAKSLDITEHLLSVNEVSAKFGTQVDTKRPAESGGLTPAVAAERLAANGPNVLTPPKRKPWWRVYLECLINLFNVLLCVAGVLQYVLLGIDPVANFPSSYIGAILIGIALLNALIEFVQLQKAQKVLESFLTMIPQKAYTIREGKLNQGPAAELVVGDVVFVKMGDKVPADLYVFSAQDMKVDNSSLTGESEPQERGPYNELRNPLEATNIVFNSTLVVAGECYGIVIRTGDSTVLGQIAGLTSSEKKRKSPLSTEIDIFVKIIAFVAILTAIVFFIAGIFIMNGNFANTINFAIGVFVAWVPEGLPATVTMLLTIAAKRMASRNVLVKELKGVETLGAITLLATDKTGTLTRNQMTATNFWTGLRMFHDTIGGNDTVSLNFPTMNTPGVSEILHISSLCARAKFDRTDVPVKEREILGDATESGLIRYAAQSLNNFDGLSELYPKVFEIPFNSDNKWHLSIHQINSTTPDGQQSNLTLFIKGAPERILRLCSSIITSDGSVEAITDQHKVQYNEAYEYMAGQGHRVLAFAQLVLPSSEFPSDFVFNKDPKNYPVGGYCFVGLASLEDPPKHGVREAIGKCRVAGVQVMMVTGDHPLTAEAIGRKINLMLSETKEGLAKRTGRPVESIEEHEVQAVVIHGERIESLTDEDWDIIFSKSEIIFARTSPKQKLEIVKRAQSLGHIVGVTGDGVNDSPALKTSDLGISMNITGSDVSKEAAAMILLDDNFASVVGGIEEGRLIFSNLKKSIKYTISHSTPEIMANLLYIIVPLPLPLTALQIIVIDLGFELFNALSYAWEPAETKTGLMKLPPRRPVTTNSVSRLRERAALHANAAGPEYKVGRFRSFINNVKRPFTDKYFWTDIFGDGEGEVLVDKNILVWAYLEAGMISTIGCFVAYFVVLYKEAGITPTLARYMQKEAASMEKNPYFSKDGPSIKNVYGDTITGEQQDEALRKAQSIYYLGVMFIQMFNLFACKATFKIPFGLHVLKNKYTWLGMIGGGGLAMLLVYVRPLNTVFSTSYKLSPIYWLIPIAFGFYLVVYASIRLIVLRKRSPTKWNPDIAGLQMFPTIWSVQSRTKNL